MEAERKRLLISGYRERVVDTLLASRKASTHKIHSHTWQVFTAWCREQEIEPMRASIPKIMDFLPLVLEKYQYPEEAGGSYIGCCWYQT